MSKRAEIFEVGPRDGLQNEARHIPLSEKIALVDLLGQAGFSRIEVASFVSAKWVPQMADSGAVLAGIERVAGVSYAALTPNIRGFEAALAARADEVAIFGSASEGFSRANINASIDESLDRFVPVAEAARDADIPLRGYVSCTVECPYDGAVSADAVLRVVRAMRAMGCYEVSLADTLGRARPEQVHDMLSKVTAEIEPGYLAAHFHDTADRALDNVAVALEHGLRVFDAAVGGLGGCPYAPGARGNVATEKVAAYLASTGYETGLDPVILDRAAGMAHKMRNG